MSDGLAGGSGARGAKVTLLGQWAKFGIQLSSTVILARLLAPSEFGLFSMIVAFSGLATLLGDFGLSSATMQAKSLGDQQRSNLFWLNVAIGILCATILFSCAPLIASFYGQPRLIQAIQILAPTFVLQAAVSQLTANLARSLRFKQLAVVDVSAQLCGFIVALVLAISGAGLIALIGQQLAVAGWTFIILMISARWLPTRPRTAEMRALLNFGRNSFLVQLLNYVSSNVDSVLLGRFWGPASLGIYDRAYQLFRMPIQQIATPLTRVVLPLLSRRQDDLGWVSAKLVQAQLLLAYGVGGVFVLAGATATSLVPVLLGDNWQFAAAILSVLAVGGLFQSLGYVYYWSFLITNRTGTQLRYSVLTRSLMVGFICLGVLGGPVGVAAGVSAGLAANWIILSYWPMKTTGLDVRRLILAAARPALIHMIVNTPVVALGLYFNDKISPFPLLIIQLATVVGMYLLVYLVFKPFRGDLKMIFTIIKKAL